MRNGSTKITLLLTLLSMADAVQAQSGTSSANYFIYIILALAVLIFFVLVVQVSDNLLAIEAKRMGPSASATNFSLFPRWDELFSRNQREYIGAEESVHVLRKGFDIRLEGEAERRIDESRRSATFAIQPTNFIGNAPIPKMMVEEKEEVKAGDPLFFDKSNPDIKYCAPVSGEVVSVQRGEKRSIVEVVILADKKMKYRDYPAFDLEKGSREELVGYLLDSGVWPMIRQRPYNVVADPKETPRDIFISTFDSAPLAPDLNFVVEGKAAAFQRGLDVLAKLTPGKVFLGLDARGKTPPSEVFTRATGVEKHWFEGKHPAGNVGVQIHHIKALGAKDKVWTMNVQDVVTLGVLFLERRFRPERVVAVTGAELQSPRYVRTYIGAKVADLVKDNLSDNHVRFISGDVLSGQRKTDEQYLDFYDDQLSVIREGDYFEMFGWLVPQSLRPSISGTFPNFLFPGVQFRADTNTHGEKRAFVVTDDYERVLPMDIFPQQLMKSILVGDFEQMEGLGINELVEEDIALCEFVCVSKQPLQQILRKGLETMREQG